MKTIIIAVLILGGIAYGTYSHVITKRAEEAIATRARELKAETFDEKEIIATQTARTDGITAALLGRQRGISQWKSTALTWCNSSACSRRNLRNLSSISMSSMHNG